MSIGRTVVRALFSSFLLFASPASAYEAEAHADSLTFIAGPDGQMRILIPVPLSGACDVPWCEDPECIRDCALDWSLLSDYVIELVFDGEEASMRIELAAYPVTTFWDPDSVSWDFPWETPGGDIFLSRTWRDKETLYSGKKKEWARFFVLDAVREASRAGHSIYGFALTAPIPRGVKESDAGLLPQEVAAIGKVEEVHFQLDFHLGISPEPPPPVEVIDPIEVSEVIQVVPPPSSPVISDVKYKGNSIPSGKSSGPVIKPPTPRHRLHRRHHHLRRLLERRRRSRRLPIRHLLRHHRLHERRRRSRRLPIRRRRMRRMRRSPIRRRMMGGICPRRNRPAIEVRLHRLND